MALYTNPFTGEVYSGVTPEMQGYLDKSTTNGVNPINLLEAYRNGAANGIAFPDFAKVAGTGYTVGDAGTTTAAPNVDLSGVANLHDQGLMRQKQNQINANQLAAATANLTGQEAIQANIGTQGTPNADGYSAGGTGLYGEFDTQNQYLRDSFSGLPTSFKMPENTGGLTTQDLSNALTTYGGATGDQLTALATGQNVTDAMKGIATGQNVSDAVKGLATGLNVSDAVKNLATGANVTDATKDLALGTDVTTAQTNILDPITRAGGLSDLATAIDSNQVANQTALMGEIGEVNTTQGGYKTAFDNLAETYGKDVKRADQKRADLELGQGNILTAANAGLTPTDISSLATAKNLQDATSGLAQQSAVETGFSDANALMANQLSGADLTALNLATGGDVSDVARSSDVEGVAQESTLSGLSNNINALGAETESTGDQLARMSNAFNAQGQLIRNQVLEDGRIVSRNMDQNGLMTEAYYNQRGQFLNTEMYDMNSLLSDIGGANSGIMAA